jgi:hypothetical protein
MDLNRISLGEKARVYVFVIAIINPSNPSGHSRYHLIYHTKLGPESVFVYFL